MRFRVIRHGVVDSTNERAFAALEEGTARSGDVHVAEGQTAGRGRRGRRWESAPGEGLYASVVLTPPTPRKGTDPLRPPLLTMAGGLAVLEAVRSLGLPTQARLKWPNDVMCGDAKLCGILVESRGLDPDDPWYVIGIGVNVSQKEFPRALVAEQPVTSLALEGVDPDPERILAILLAALSTHIETAVERPAALAAAYLEATGLRDQPVRVERGSDAVEGRLVTLDLERGLVLEDEAGEEQVVPLEHATGVARARGSATDPPLA